MNPDLLLKENRDKFIDMNSKFILNVTRRICKKDLVFGIDKELDLAISAFNKACDNFSNVNVNFYGYARVIIKNELINYYKSSLNKMNLFFDDAELDLDYTNYINSLSDFEILLDNKQRLNEIAELKSDLNKFGLKLKHIVSPKKTADKNAILAGALVCSEDSAILVKVKSYKKPSIKELSEVSGLSKIFIFKWYKYFVIELILFSYDKYLYLKNFLNIKVGS